MNVSENFTGCEQNETCGDEVSGNTYLQEQLYLVFWNVFDKILVIIFNGITLIILIRYAKLQTPSNIFVACLTSADLFSALTLPFGTLTIYLSNRTFWTISCIANVLTGFISSMVNSLILCVIAVDRLLYILYSLEYNLLVTPKRAAYVSVCLWIYAIIFSSVCVSTGYRDAFFFGLFARPCNTYISLDGYMTQLIGVQYKVLIPITVLIYIRIGHLALKQKRSIAAATVNPGAGPGSVQSAADYKITKVMLSILVVYVGCNLMVYTQYFSFIIVPRRYRYLAFQMTFFFWRINTWMNPIIYVLSSQRFRRYVRAFFTGRSVQAQGNLF